jgi:hypothetical protein
MKKPFKVSRVNNKSLRQLHRGAAAIACRAACAYLHGMRNRFPASAMLLFLCAGAARPGNAAAPDIFSSDLESLDVSCFVSRPGSGCSGWIGIHDASISLVRDGVAHSGRQALKIDFTKNENYGAAWRAVNTRHLFTRFYDYYAKNFDFAAGMKINRLSGFNEAKQINDFDIILQLKADDPASDYCGLTDAKYLALSFNGGPIDWGSVEVRWTPQRERWYCIETEVKLNTPGSSDGELRIWIDGIMVAEKKGMDLTADVASPINRALFGGWYSNAAAGKNPCPDPVQESIRYVDDPALSGSYIGPMLGTGPSRPKHPPGNLKSPQYDPIPD